MSTGCRSRIATHSDLVLYDFGPYHPLRPERVTAGLDLLQRAGLWSPERETLTPAPSPDGELALVHDEHYIRAVDEAGNGHLPHSELARYGLTTSDNPAFPSMHYAAALVAGACVEAARQVLCGESDHVFSPAGGLHHALRARASGFCIFNDPAVAAAVALRRYQARVLYVDFDCHHGDGVQWLFYDDPDVLTISFHETGRFLFPGTGDVSETGDGAGRGYSVNMPFAPFTRDPQWMAAVEAILPPLAARFKPDVLISNHGCDTHVWDPITHLALTTASFRHQARLTHRLAHELCGGRWVAVGSGGYDWRRVVPRSWSIVWSEMANRALLDALPLDWIERWSGTSDEPMPARFLDDEELSPPLLRDDEVRRLNDDSLRAVLRVHGLAATGVDG